jgi:carbon monoxide dehydrogenase subunit G
MAISIDTSFVVPAPLEEAWAILIDVPRIAPCMPGAELTEVIDATTYKGLARVKIGPMQLVFGGEARLNEANAASHVSKMTIRGSDIKGRGSVDSEMRFSLVSEDRLTRVNVHTELSLSGSVAQYGRGVGLIKEMCNQFAQQFAKNLAASIQSGTEGTVQRQVKPLSAIGLVAGAVKAMAVRGTRSAEPPANDERSTS